MVQGNKMGCRFCNSPLDNIFIELGNAPPTNSFRTEEQLKKYYLLLTTYKIFFLCFFC